MRCRGCGGILGRDCFNQFDCEWITRDMEQRAAMQQEQQPEQPDRQYEALLVNLLRECQSALTGPVELRQAIEDAIGPRAGQSEADPKVVS